MSTHAAPPLPPVAGVCAWVWHFEDVDMCCDTPVVPGGWLCAEHLVAAVTAADAAKKRKAQR